VFEAPGGTQIHDFNPGIEASGLFWTLPINPHDVNVNPGSGRAVMDVRNVEMEDYHDFVNAILDGPSLEGLVSFRAEWAGSNQKRRFHNTAQQYDGHIVLTSATCSWIGESVEARYVSSPHGQITVYAEVGQVRNGVFFS
jgi:hypothetical protein